jgi:hypothetical protein
LGKKVVVEVYSKYPVVELFINDKSLGKKEVKKAYVEYELPYEKGSLKALGYDINGNFMEEYVLSSSAKASMNLSLDYTGDDLSIIYVKYMDEYSTLDTTIEKEISVEVEGARLLGFGSANPKTEDNYLSNKCHTWKGMAMAIIKKESENPIIRVKSNDEEKMIKL